MTRQEPEGRVLVVEDNAALLEIYREFLEEAGHSVETAANGREALELLARDAFDVILSDIAMPGMTGVELLRAVRERDLDVPVVLVTGNPQVETAAQAVDYGALRYLLKPLDGETLRQAVGEAVRLHRIAALKREALAHLGAEDKLLGDRASLEATFERARGSLWMAYQPIVRASDGRLFGHEALVRSSERTLPHPGALFDAAERLGRVRDLGRAIRDSVAPTAVAGAGGTVFVNLHPQELSDEALYSSDAALTTAASSVVLEITERELLDGVQDVRSRVQALRVLGYRIAVDDLGAGYAGLTSFVALEPDIVKLDMSLVRAVDREPIKRRLIGSIAGLCEELGILVVAEGIETEDERETVVGLGCDLLQGFLFGKPARLGGT